MALSLYVSTMEIALRVNPSNEYAWFHIYGSLCCLRQSLLCCVCKKLLMIPHKAKNARCQHHYCKHCVGGWKPKCTWCTDTKFEESLRLGSILQCYKRMCRYIMISGICRCSTITKLTSPRVKFISIVYEGAGLDDSYYTKDTASKPLKKKQKRSPRPKHDHGNAKSINGQRTLYSIKLSDSTSPKVMIRKTSITESVLANYDSDGSSDESEIDCPDIIEECLRSVQERKTCQCGTVTQNPKKLKFICHGKKCPCYVDGKACISCECKGCKNPKKNYTSPPLSALLGHDINGDTIDETYSDLDRDPFAEN